MDAVFLSRSLRISFRRPSLARRNTSYESPRRHGARYLFFFLFRHLPASRLLSHRFVVFCPRKVGRSEYRIWRAIGGEEEGMITTDDSRKFKDVYELSVTVMPLHLRLREKYAYAHEELARSMTCHRYTASRVFILQPLSLSVAKDASSRDRMLMLHQTYLELRSFSVPEQLARPGYMHDMTCVVAAMCRVERTSFAHCSCG
ncbi:hypothetical protein C8Q73DRAFT_74210 [Cubamyces lactineus]|nr:hypothetical protein C8Q73DRAFT_74210 [Cubamyces lactineus]